VLVVAALVAAVRVVNTPAAMLPPQAAVLPAKVIAVVAVATLKVAHIAMVVAVAAGVL
jgi:hypothetical protein